MTEAEPAHKQNQQKKNPPLSRPGFFSSHSDSSKRLPQIGSCAAWRRPPAASRRALKNISRRRSRRPPAPPGDTSGQTRLDGARLETAPPNADRLLRAGSRLVVISCDTARRVDLGEPWRRPGLELIPRSEKCHVELWSADGAETVWLSKILTNNLTPDRVALTAIRHFNYD